MAVRQPLHARAPDTAAVHRRGVRLYAHRGSPGTTSFENTVPAVSASLAAGADGVEVDLRLSADGVLVVSHDAGLQRLAGVPLEITRTRWDELRLACAAHGVPLARAEWVLAAAAGRPVVLELKTAPPGETPRTAVALVELLSSLHAARLPLDVTVSSFSPALVRAVRDCAPGRLRLRTALLGDVRQSPTTVLRQALADGHDEIHPHVGALLAEPKAVAAAHALGARVVPWTVNRGRDMRRLASLGVDAMITDVPVAARLALAPRTSRSSR